MNTLYNLQGENKYPEDLPFLAFDEEIFNGSGVERLKLFRISVGARWLDDIVSNNAIKNEQYNQIEHSKTDQDVKCECIELKKEDFKYGNQHLSIEDKYVFENEQIVVIVNNDIFDADTIEYANKLVEKYICDRDKILNYMLDIDLRELYSSYSEEYIKNNIGRAQINICFKKDASHPNWKFNYAGIIDFCESKLDEHIISIEFKDNLELDKNIQLNG